VCARRRGIKARASQSDVRVVVGGSAPGFDRPGLPRLGDDAVHRFVADVQYRFARDSARACAAYADV